MRYWIKLCVLCILNAFLVYKNHSDNRQHCQSGALAWQVKYENKICSTWTYLFDDIYKNDIRPPVSFDSAWPKNSTPSTARRRTACDSERSIRRSSMRGPSSVRPPLERFERVTVNQTPTRTAPNWNGLKGSPSVRPLPNGLKGSPSIRPQLERLERVNVNQAST